MTRVRLLLLELFGGGLVVALVHETYACCVWAFLLFCQVGYIANVGRKRREALRLRHAGQPSTWRPDAAPTLTSDAEIIHERILERHLVVAPCKHCHELTPVDLTACKHCGAPCREGR